MKTEGLLYAAPGSRDTAVLGSVCSDDAVDSIGMQEVDTMTWYHVRVTARGRTCMSAVALARDGWASELVFNKPSFAMQRYMDAVGMAVPTPIVYPTNVPTRVPVVAALRPAAPSSSGGSGGSGGSTSGGSGVRVGATCRDGSHSNATGRGACSHHGGVAHWLYR